LVGPPSDAIALDGGFFMPFTERLDACFFWTMLLFSAKRNPESVWPNQYWRKHERRIVMKQERNKKTDLLIYIGIFLFCAFLIYQMLTPHP
jgi:hypothetical protein